MKKVLSTLIGSSILATTAVAGGAGEAHATLTLTTPTCSAASSSFSPNYIDCSGAFEGNDANQPLDVLAELSSAFSSHTGAGTWASAGKSDDSNNGPFTSNPETTIGTLTFDTAKLGYFTISLKASTSFSLYLFDGGTTGISSVAFNTIGTATNKQGNAQALSHASLFTFSPSTPPPAPVPEPFTFVGTAVFLGVGAFAKKKYGKK